MNKDFAQSNAGQEADLQPYRSFITKVKGAEGTQEYSDGKNAKWPNDIHTGDGELATGN
jgi:type III secretory pathway component EscR